MERVFPEQKDRPASPGRLVAGLIYLQHTFNCSDEMLVEGWVENPYWQYFCGETYLQHEVPVDPSSLSRWRRRMGEEGVEWLLTATIEAARRAQVIKANSAEKLIVDTTVMEKAVSFPTDSKLLDCARCQGYSNFPRSDLRHKPVQVYVRTPRGGLLKFH